MSRVKTKHHFYWNFYISFYIALHVLLHWVYYYGQLIDLLMDQIVTSTANLLIIYSSTVMILFILFVQNLKDHRLNTTVIKYVHADFGVECVLLCLNEDTSCRSTNFRKTSNSDNNCELLRDVHAEKPDLLLGDVHLITTNYSILIG
jgi:hypothetical protein